MRKWLLTDNLDGNEAAWLQLAQAQLGHPTHADRLRGFSLAREALRRLLESVGENPQIDDLALSQPNQLEKYPQFTCSLSHTAQLGAAMLASGAEYLAVGIDIEQRNRQLRPAVLARISHQNDLALAGLKIWCLKEAAFKALMNSGQFERPVEFSSIQIKAEGWQREQISGEWELHEQQDHYVALAWIKKQNSFRPAHDPQS
jgi:4'-phosphopantetheinyl transferase EntD